MISCSEWWPSTKPGSITITRRQSNNQWRCGIAAHPAQKFLIAKISWKFLAWNFFGSRGHPLHLLSSKGPNYQRGVLLISAGAIEGHFERKTPREVHQGCFVLVRQRPGSSGTGNPEETDLPGLPISWSPTLFSGIGPVGLQPVPWTEKKQLKFLYFSSNAEVIPVAETWLDVQHSEFFWVDAKVRATG